MYHDDPSDPAERGSTVLSPPDRHESGRRGKLVFLTHLDFSSRVFLSEREFVTELTQQACAAALRSPVHKLGTWLAPGTWISGGLPPSRYRACRAHENSVIFTEQLLSFWGSEVVGAVRRASV